jgi:hypothetical protein
MPTRRNLNAIMAVLFKREPIEPALCDKKELELMAHLTALQTGDATDATFDALSLAVGIGAFRTADGDFQEAQPAIAEAQTALGNILDRAHKHRRWGASGEDLRALQTVIPIYIAMLRASTHLEMQHASRAAMQSAHAEQRKLQRKRA